DRVGNRGRAEVDIRRFPAHGPKNPKYVLNPGELAKVDSGTPGRQSASHPLRAGFVERVWTPYRPAASLGHLRRPRCGSSCPGGGGGRARLALASNPPAGPVRQGDIAWLSQTSHANAGPESDFARNVRSRHTLE